MRRRARFTMQKAVQEEEEEEQEDVDRNAVKLMVMGMASACKETWNLHVRPPVP